MSNKTAVVFSNSQIGDLDYDYVRYLNPRYWDGKIIECDAVFTDDKKIASVYREQGVEVRPITEIHKSKLENKFDTTGSFPEKPGLDCDSMSWPKLRSLASQISDEPIKSKKQALEVLKNSR